MAGDVSCLALGTDFSAASARIQRSGSKPIGRTTTSRDAGASSIRITRQRRDLGLDGPRRTPLPRVFPSQALPWPPRRPRTARPHSDDRPERDRRAIVPGCFSGFTVVGHRHASFSQDRHALNLLIVFPYPRRITWLGSARPTCIGSGITLPVKPGRLR